jgi:hypothetical protein
MAPTSPYKTLSNIRLAVIRDAKETTASTMVSLVDRWINEGYEMVGNRKKRKWLDQQFTVQVSAAVDATCRVTNASTAVTFTAGTTFPTGVELQFWNRGFEEIYDVASTTSASLTLAKAYLGTTNTAASGVVFQKSILVDTSIRDIFQIYHQYDTKPLTNIGPQQMRMVQERSGVQLNTASYYSIFGSSSSALRVLLYPYPLDAYTLYLDTNLLPAQMTADTDEPLIPIKFRQMLYWYGSYKLWLYHRNDSNAATALTNFNSLLAQMDGELSPTIDYPQIQVSYIKARTLQQVAPPFDPSWRSNS